MKNIRRNNNNSPLVTDKASDDLINALLKSELFHSVSRKILEQFIKNSKIRVFDAGSYIFRPSDPTDYIYLLIRGKITLYLLSSSGKRLILRNVFPVSFFGAEGFLRHTSHFSFAEAREDSQVCIVRLNKFETLVKQREDILIHVFKYIGNYVEDIDRRVLDMSSEPVMIRMISFLKHNVDINSNTINGYSHEDIADIISTSRQTITKCLNQMQNQGILKIDSRKIIILDWRKFNDFEYSLKKTIDHSK